MDLIKEIVSVARSAIIFCSICQDSVKDAVLLRCNHVFCSDCFQLNCNIQKKSTPRKKSISCPNCKTVIPKNSTFGTLNSEMDNDVFQELILHLECETGIDLTHIKPSSQENITFPKERFRIQEEPEEFPLSTIPQTCIEPTVSKFKRSNKTETVTRSKHKSTVQEDPKEFPLSTIPQTCIEPTVSKFNSPKRITRGNKSETVTRSNQKKEECPIQTKKSSPKKLDQIESKLIKLKPIESKSIKSYFESSKNSSQGFNLDLDLQKSGRNSTKDLENLEPSQRPSHTGLTNSTPEDNLDDLSLTVLRSQDTKSLPSVSGLSFPSNIGPTFLNPDDGIGMLGNSKNVSLTAQERQIINKYLGEEMELEADVIQNTVFKTPRKVVVEEDSEESEVIIQRKQRKAKVIESSSSSNSPESIDCSMERKAEDWLFADSPSTSQSIRYTPPPAKLQEKGKSFDSVWKRIKKSNQTSTPEKTIPEEKVIDITETQMPATRQLLNLDENQSKLIDEITANVINGIDCATSCNILRNDLGLSKIQRKIVKLDKFTNTDILVIQCPDCLKKRNEESVEMVDVSIAPTQNLRIESQRLRTDYDYLLTSSFDEEMMNVCADIDNRKGGNTQERQKLSEEIPIQHLTLDKLVTTQASTEPAMKKRTQSDSENPFPKRLKSSEEPSEDVTVIDSSEEEVDCIYSTPESKPAYSQLDRSRIPGTEFTPTYSQLNRSRIPGTELTPNRKPRRKLIKPLISVEDIEPFETPDELLTLPDRTLTPPPEFGDENQCDFTKLPEMTILKQMKTPAHKLNMETLKEGTILISDESQIVESCIGPTPYANEKRPYKAPLQVVKDQTPNIISTPVKQTSITSYTTTPKSTQSSQLSISKAREFFRKSEPPVAQSTPKAKLFNRSKKINLMFTQLRASEIELLHKFCKVFNVEFTAANSENTTHLVTQTDENNWVPNYTVKYVCAIANGKWVVSIKWIEDSLALNKILPEDLYEVLDSNGSPGPRNSRLKGKPSDLFKRFQIFVMSTPDSFPRQNFLGCLIRNGAQICATLEELIQKKKKGIPLIIAESPETCNLQIFQDIYDKSNILSVSSEWVFKSICSFQVESLARSLLCMLTNTQTGYPPELLVESEIFDSEAPVQ